MSWARGAALAGHDLGFDHGCGRLKGMGMQKTEWMAFANAGLERSAHLRGDAAAQEALLARGRILPFWRGKPLLRAGASLGFLALGDPALRHGGPPVFLGFDDDHPCFAVDISAWEPGPDSQEVVPGFFDPTVQRHPDLDDTLGFCELRGAMVALTAREAEIAATARAILQWHQSHRFCAACGAASVSAMAGWQRDCPACAAHHFPRTDPVVIMLVTHGNRALLGRSPGWPQGMYSCLAGFVEPGETIEAAVRREVLEETGVTTGPVRYVASQPWPFPANLMFGCQAQATSETIRIDPAELEDALWISREEMVTVMAGAHPTVKPARKGAIAHFLIQNWLAGRLD